MKRRIHGFEKPHALLFATLLLVPSLAAAEKHALRFEIAGMSCETSCAPAAKKALEKIPGVTTASVNFTRKEGRIEASRKVSADEVRRALSATGFEARFPGDDRGQPLTAEERRRADIATASRGEAFDIRKHLAPGKITLFDYWAEWCGPCHVLTPKLERLALEKGFALRKVDISDWDSPAGKQATREFQLPALPYVRLYGPDGRFLGAVVGNDIDAIKKIVEENR